MNYSPFLERCHQLAQTAKQNGNAPVGALIIRGPEIIAEGMEATQSKQDVSAHAEMEAIRIARRKIGKDLSGCELISTHEPCIMCSYAIRFHGINTVVFEHASEKLGGFTSRFDILSTADVPGQWPAKPKVIRV